MPCIFLLRLNSKRLLVLFHTQPHTQVVKWSNPWSKTLSLMASTFLKQEESHYYMKLLSNPTTRVEYLLCIFVCSFVRNLWVLWGSESGFSLSLSRSAHSLLKASTSSLKLQHHHWTVRSSSRKFFLTQISSRTQFLSSMAVSWWAKMPCWLNPFKQYARKVWKFRESCY